MTINRIRILKYHFIKLIILAFFILQNFSCGRDGSSLEKASDSYIENLKHSIPEMNITSGNLSGQSSILEPHRVEFLPNSGLFVVVDDADKSIVLLNEQGEILSRAGGEGRGPGEFQSIVQLHVGYDNRIYLLDMLLFRITVYEIANDQLRSTDTFSYKNPPVHSLNGIYVTESGNFGVYNQTEEFQTPDNRFLLYRLDENFAPVEQLLEMPGNERRRVDSPKFTLFLPSDFLSKTFWYVDGEWFYYITSYQPSVNKYDLRTGDKEVVSFFQFQERFNDSDHANFLKKRYDSIKDEQYWDVLENSKTLPLFSGFWVQDDKITLRMFYPAGEDGMMIYIDQGTDEIKYFEMPHEFYQQFLREDRIYGIDYKTDDYSRLMFINMHSR